LHVNSFTELLASFASRAEFYFEVYTLLVPHLAPSERFSPTTCKLDYTIPTTCKLETLWSNLIKFAEIQRNRIILVCAGNFAEKLYIATTAVFCENPLPRIAKKSNDPPPISVHRSTDIPGRSWPNGILATTSVSSPPGRSRRGCATVNRGRTPRPPHYGKWQLSFLFSLVLTEADRLEQKYSWFKIFLFQFHYRFSAVANLFVGGAVIYGFL
jgi:hypothetical protein